MQHAQDGARLGPRELLLVAQPLPLRLGPCSRKGLLDAVGIEAVQSEGRWRVLLLVQGRRRRRRNAAATGRLATTVAAREAAEHGGGGVMGAEAADRGKCSFVFGGCKAGRGWFGKGLLGGRHGRRRGHGAPLFLCGWVYFVGGDATTYT